MSTPSWFQFFPTCIGHLLLCLNIHFFLHSIMILLQQPRLSALSSHLSGEAECTRGLQKKSQLWPWLCEMAHFTSVTSVASSAMAMCFQPNQSGSRRHHSGHVGRQTSSFAHEAVTSKCVLVSVFEGRNIP